MKLSAHFTLAEMTFTQVRHMNNQPSLADSQNLSYLCNNVLEPLRSEYGPMITHSGYRSAAVNNFIGGSKTSMHVKGCAWDGHFAREGLMMREVIAYLQRRDDLPVDQVIYEYGRWLHIGTKPNGVALRREFLMIFGPGKYELWNPLDKRITI